MSFKGDSMNNKLIYNISIIVLGVLTIASLFFGVLSYQGKLFCSFDLTKLFSASSVYAAQYMFFALITSVLLAVISAFKLLNFEFKNEKLKNAVVKIEKYAPLCQLVFGVLYLILLFIASNDLNMSLTLGTFLVVLLILGQAIIKIFNMYEEKFHKAQPVVETDTDTTETTTTTDTTETIIEE